MPASVIYSQNLVFRKLAYLPVNRQMKRSTDRICDLTQKKTVKDCFKSTPRKATL